MPGPSLRSHKIEVRALSVFWKVLHHSTGCYVMDKHSPKKWLSIRARNIIKGSHDQAKPFWEIIKHSYSVPIQIISEKGQGFMIQSSLVKCRSSMRELILREKLVREQGGRLDANPSGLGRIWCKRERYEAVYLVGETVYDRQYRKWYTIQDKRPSLTIQAQKYSFNWPAILSLRLKAANAKGDSSIPSSANLRSKVSGTE